MQLISKVQSLYHHTPILLAPVSSARLVKITSATLAKEIGGLGNILSCMHLFFYGPKVIQLCMVYAFLACSSSKRHATIL